MQYQGQKFYYTYSTFKQSNNFYDDTKTEIKHFAMTKSYRKYLAEKRIEDLKNEIKICKEKLTYQYKHYGQVDDLDFKYFEYLLNKLNNMEA